MTDALAEDDKGVEIEVTPAGKATRRLSLLSGGEKSLVALAFVFAVFLARPSPFYILDEVEAALDDANIDRFLQLVRRFSDRAQFVIVTHQKRTMDAADVLYGVWMGDGGVTKVVSRRLPQDGDAARRCRPTRTSPQPASSAPRSCASERSSISETVRLRHRRGDAAEGEPDDERRGVFRRLRESLWKSREALGAELSASLCDHLDAETWERLEEALILADVGAPDDRRGRRQARDGGRGGRGRGAGGGARAPDRAARRGRRHRRAARSTSRKRPAVVMMVGVNGSGKTTTIGKLAWHLQKELGLSVILAAADTYRAAAVEQLETWAERRVRDRQGGPNDATRAPSPSTRSPPPSRAASTS